MKKTVLITGINGFLGSHLAKHLKSNFEVIGLEYSLENLHRIASENFKVYSTNDTILETIFKENEFYAVIHVATLYKRQYEPIFNLLNTNINLPVQLLELSGKYDVNLFLNTDSFFNNPSYSYSYLSDYTLSKKHALEWIKLLSSSSKCKVANMKVFHMFGEHDAPIKFIPFLIDKIKNNEPILDLSPGTQTRDFIYIKDVVTSFECILNSFSVLKEYQEFEVGTGVSYTVKELALLIKEITNSKTQLNFGGIPFRKGEIMESESNIFSLKDLGWEPSFNLQSALKNCINNV
ncbi:NAD-dependent epimerase/dehydratase family protein [uncultured Winogradskyella sp.]|uniref:NAD-dependent epimerase/dehydratase family protein n=1 Tax=uncultured Winogradskyella sp. TaxID=395353 RepID=UPI0030DA6878